MRGLRAPARGGAQISQVKLALHPPELLGGFEHSRRAPADDHLAVPPTLDVAGWSRQRSAFVDRSVDRSVGGTPSRTTVRSLVKSFEERAGRARMLLLQVGGESSSTRRSGARRDRHFKFHARRDNLPPRGGRPCGDVAVLPLFSGVFPLRRDLASAARVVT